MKVDEALNAAYNILSRSDVTHYHIDAQLILARILNRDRLYILTNPDDDISPALSDIYLKSINDRARGCPLPYITNTREFYSLGFYIDSSVLIPRDDTEILVETAVKMIGGKGATVLDIGTGSGIIAVGIAKHCENAVVTATDMSPAALGTAKKNAAINGVDIIFRYGNLFDALTESGRPFDFIISNPPYIKTDDIKTLDKSVKAYEPIEALDGGADGLYFYREIIGRAGEYLAKDGNILFEIGHGQACDVRNILTKNGFTDIKIIKDTGNLDRVVTAKNAKGKKVQTDV